MATAPFPPSIQAAVARWSGPILETVASVMPRPERAGDGSLADMIWYHLDTGGKRLRPLLVLMAAEALGGNPEHALPFATGVELLHNATLVHDDYQDGDEVRRGRPTVWVRYGFEQSINAGDGLYFAGVQLAARCPIPPDRVRRLLDMTSARLLQVIAGQVNELNLKHVAAPTEAAYVEVIRGKTAGLFALPLEGAAIAAGATDAEVRDLATAGDTLGLLFQVQDDLLDLLGDKGRDQRGTDIAEGKASLPVVHALRTAPAAAAARLGAIVRTPRAETTPAEIAEALDILEASGAIDHALARVRTWRSEIRCANPAVQTLLRDIVDAVLAPIAARV